MSCWVRLLRRVVVAVSGMWIAGAASAQNVVMVVADDVGVDRIGAYGHWTAAPTPRIDTLAQQGVRFERAWANRICSPSRASILTGLLPLWHGVGTNVSQGTNPNSNQGLDPSLPTIATELRASGYRTAAIGKWHLAGAGTAEAILAHPAGAGFDYYAGGFGGLRKSTTGLESEGYFDWEKCVSIGGIGSCALTTTYATTDATDEAIAQLSGSEPFFLYLAYNASHEPSHDPPWHLHSFDGQCTGPVLTPVCHKAMTEAMDSELGRLLDAIDFTDTTVIFVGDNGTPSTAVQLPFDPGKSKGTNFEGGVRVPLVIAGQAIGPQAVGGTSAAVVHVTDFFATIMELVGVSAGALDSISLMPYLADPQHAPLRRTQVTESFVPNGGAPGASSHFRVASNQEGYKLNNWAGAVAFYDLMTDPHETAPLNPLALTTLEQTAYDELAPLVGANPVPEPGLAVSLVAGVGFVAGLVARRGRKRPARV